MPRVPPPPTGSLDAPSPTWVGIDPGASGGIAAIKDGELVFWKMPDSETDLWELFRTIGSSWGPSFALIEMGTACLAAQRAAKAVTKGAGNPVRPCSSSAKAMDPFGWVSLPRAYRSTRSPLNDGRRFSESGRRGLKRRASGRTGYEPRPSSFSPRLRARSSSTSPTLS